MTINIHHRRASFTLTLTLCSLLAGCALGIGSMVPLAAAGPTSTDTGKPVVPLREVVIIEAEDGVEVVAPQVAPWCSALPPTGESSTRSANGSSRPLASLRDGRANQLVLATRAVMQAVCEDPADEKVQQQTASLVQFWVNHTGATKTDVVAFLGTIADPDAFTAIQREHCDALGTTRDDDRVARTAFGCASDDRVANLPPFTGDVWAPSYLGGVFHRQSVAGRGGDPPGHRIAFADLTTELARAQFTIECFSAPGEFVNRELDARACGADALPLDTTRLTKQLAKASLSAWAETIARVTHAYAKRLQHLAATAE